MPMMPLREASRQLGITTDTLRAQVHRGRLRATKLSRDWFVDQAEVDRYRRESLGRRQRRRQST